MRLTSIMTRISVAILFATALALSVSTCGAPEACQTYQEVCAKIDEPLCVEVLEGQPQAVISCVYYAETCVEVHECLEVEEERSEE